MTRKSGKKGSGAQRPARKSGAEGTPRIGPPNAGPRLTRTRLAWLLLAVVGLATAGVLTVWPPPRNTGGAHGASLPAPRMTFTDSTIADSDFVGSAACASCHAGQYAAWTRSTHGNAGGLPGTVRLVGSFNGTPIRFKDAVVTPSMREGRPTFTIRQNARPDRVVRVDGVIGGGHMAGGGTQGFVTRIDDGTYRFVPFDFSRHSNTWFCNTIGRGNHGWVPVTPDLSIAACIDWPPSRALGDDTRFSNCASCHGSQITTQADSAAQGYRTHFTALNINCESCHGPGRHHIALARDSAAIASGKLGMAALATYPKDSSLGVCWQCHALKDQLRPNFVSGKPLEAYYSTRTPQLGDEAYLPDGRVRTFAYQQGHLYSDCYVNGGMTCTSCHDPHSQQYRDVVGNPLPGRFDDRQCTSCHASKAANPTLHTKHAASSAGSRCTSCHMPYLQEPEIGTAIRYSRSDHAIPIPRPAFDSSQGVVSACRTCHQDKSESTLNAQMVAWYGEIKPHPRAIDALVRARTISDRGQVAKLLLVPDERLTAVLFDGMAYFLDHHLDADMDGLERDIVSRLTQLAKHTDLDVRALALASLHFAAGNDGAVHSTLVSALDQAGRDEVNLRARWGVILGYLADKLRNNGQSPAAIATYRKAIEVTPSNPKLYLNLGLAYTQARDLVNGIAQYRRSLELDPRQALALINLGIALDEQGNPAEAAATYRKALALNPRDPMANFNLGNIALKAGDWAQAAAQYEKTVAADPSIAVAHFYLARARLRLGDARESLRQVELGLEFDPSNDEGLRARDQLRRMVESGTGR
ncbi:MAG: tetratricopeptide repeat protein [Gemmatimonadaceae bacterium]